jgi:hypothetical protein
MKDLLSLKHLFLVHTVDELLEDTETTREGMVVCGHKVPAPSNDTLADIYLTVASRELRRRMIDHIPNDFSEADEDTLFDRLLAGKLDAKESVKTMEHLLRVAQVAADEDDAAFLAWMASVWSAMNGWPVEDERMFRLELAQMCMIQARAAGDVAQQAKLAKAITRGCLIHLKAEVEDDMARP